MVNILITGGTGLVGQALIPKLLEKGHKVSILSRKSNQRKDIQTFLWNVNNNEIDDEALKDVDFIIHLAGAGVAEKRWSKKRKQEILDSRVKSTQLLFDKIKELKIPLKGFITASGTGYYGSITTDIIFKENDKPANDFLGTVCKEWEKTALQFETLRIDTSIVRTGVVLSKKGGALSKMITPIITPLGSGKQFMPWVHIEDLCKIYTEIIEGKITGTFNAVAPEHHTNFSFSKILAKKFGRPFLKIGIPAFLLKLFFGKMAVILLKGSRVSSQKLIDNGFGFNFPSLNKALTELSNK